MALISGLGRTAVAVPGTRVQASGVRVVRGGRRVLDDVHLRVEPGRLVAVIGASGAGKTTLLDALSGVSRPTAGTVLHDGVDRSATAEPVGYLPQDDVIHRDLPLATTLHYAGRLRLPAGTARIELRTRIGEVLEILGLSDRADVRVGSLSGGERKRAGIGVELLTRPRVFFLDEPTSGLDPVTGAGLVATLRGLADAGTTVLFSTHHAADVTACDEVVVLARGGQVAFTGTPDAARAHFGVGTVEEIYTELADERIPPTVPASNGIAAQPFRAPVPAPPRLGPARQALVLSARTADLVRRNRLTLAVLLGSPVMIVAMFLVLFRGGAFDPAAPSPSTTVMIIFWIAFGGFFFGLTYGLLQICTELPIVRRERLAGVRLAPYLASKVVVLLPLLAAVDVLLLAALRLLDRLPALGGPDFAAMFLSLLLASAAALALGLLCSAVVSDAAQATLALPMLCFPQVLFVGAILPVPLMAPVGRWLSVAMTNRWSFEALGHGAGLAALWRDGSSPLGPPLLASYGDSFERALWPDWTVLAGFTVLLLVAAWAVLVVRCRGDRRG